MTDLINNPSISLRARKCVPCEGGVPILGEEEIKNYMPQLKEGWVVLAGQRIQKLFKFKDFKEAMEFVTKIADLAESEGHHPNITIDYSKVNIVIWTHAIGGLSENDFILAAKIDKII